MGFMKVRQRILAPAVSLGSSNIQFKTAVVQCTNAQLLALLGTPKTIIAAPAAGKVIVVQQVFFWFDVTTTAYTLGTADLRLSWGTAQDYASLTEAGFLDQTTDQGRAYGPAAITIPTAATAFQLRALTADMTGGNAANTLSIAARYAIMPAAAFSV